MNENLDCAGVIKSITELKASASKFKKTVFVSGNFNIVHPGHLRLLKFARECGDFLLVGLQNDRAAGIVIPQKLRLEAVAALGVVDFAFVLSTSLEEFISQFEPDIVVKGHEHQNSYNPEGAAIAQYGGKLLFSSGDARFSSLDLLRRDFFSNDHLDFIKPSDFLSRHAIDNSKLITLVKEFSNLRVLVIGDIIIDEYIICEALGMSREDPTIVVAPIDSKKYIGGAGAVASHANGLGAQVSFFTVVGKDALGDFAIETLSNHGVNAVVHRDDSRPTTLKQRFRTSEKTLLRVSHLTQAEISPQATAWLLERIATQLMNTDLVIFSDFNYGCLPQGLVDAVRDLCIARQIPMVADSQSSSQTGDISRFKNMLLVTPTEYEARLALKDSNCGLSSLAIALLEDAQAKYAFITLGKEGLLIQAAPDQSDDSGILTDQLPAFNRSPIDVSGAGDCLITTAAMAMVAGATVWEGAYLGSIAAACQVGRLGNLPLPSQELIRELVQ
jgi:rfaE bifunctional protein kinase chain/domain